MIDPTEYDPNSRDSTDDPDFVGDNDHGESAPPLISRLLSLSHQAKKLLEGASDRVDPLYLNCMRRTEDECLSAAADIKALREDLKASLEAHDEMRLEIVRLTKERDEARRESCVWGSRTEMGARSLAKFKGWDCYKKEETQ